MRSATRVKISCALTGSTASVIITESIVASAGASIPAPFAIPANCAPFTVVVATLGTLSVVIIACETSSNESPRRLDAIVSSPAMILGIGSSSPIRPVEQTTTSPEEIPRSSPTFSAVW